MAAVIASKKALRICNNKPEWGSLGKSRSAYYESPPDSFEDFHKQDQRSTAQLSVGQL